MNGREAQESGLWRNAWGCATSGLCSRDNWISVDSVSGSNAGSVQAFCVNLTPARGRNERDLEARGDFGVRRSRLQPVRRRRRLGGMLATASRVCPSFLVLKRAVPMKGEDDLAARVRACLAGVEGVSEMKMFGGVGFMLNGNMLAGTSKRGLLLRVGKERHAEAVAEPGMRAMEQRGRVMEGYVYADPPPALDAALKAWLERALDHVRTLAPKPAKTKGK